MMAEIFQVERKAAVIEQRNELFHFLSAGWIAVGGKPHQLVFVAIMGKAEILGHGLVEDAERMRKQHAAVERQVSSAADTPRRAGKIAEAIDRDDNSFAERRGIER